MSKHDDRVSLQDMLDRGREAISLLGDIDRESLASERVTQLALIQLVQIIGEAATRVSHETRMEFSEILPDGFPEFPPKKGLLPPSLRIISKD